MFIPLLIGIALGCAPTAPIVSNEFAPRWPSAPEGRRVLVVWNRNVPESKELAEYYAKARAIPVEHIHMVSVVNKEDTHIDEVKTKIFETVRAKIKALKFPIDFIVLMKGVPILVWDNHRGYSLDAYLATMDMNLPTIANDPPSGADMKAVSNPYFGKNEPFSRAKYGMYLVTRLDGYTFADARKLVDNSIKSKANKGPFLMDTTGTRGSGGYAQMHDELVEAGKKLVAKGYDTNTDMSPMFVNATKKLAGYAGWGSNDPKFDKAGYKALTFLPGAIGETFVSTSARTMNPVSDGQSVITDLIASGITGIKGYVREPYTFALARPSILFDRYTSGYTLAESYYMASPFLKWRDLIVGDPICAPYKK